MLVGTQPQAATPPPPSAAVLQSAAVPVAAVLAVLGAALGGFVLGRRGPAPVSAAARPVPPPENRLEHRIAMAAFLGERDVCPSCPACLYCGLGAGRHWPGEAAPPCG